jgi:mitogen-activated protein kinase organizer 1
MESHRNQLDDLPRAMPIQTYTAGLTHPVSAVAVVESSDTQQLLLATCDKTLVVMDLVTNQVVRRLQGHTGLINALGAAPKAEAYLSAGYDGTVCIWDGRSSRDYKPIQILKDAKDSVTDLQVVVPQGTNANAGGSTAAMGLIRTASVDGMVRTYDLRMGVLRQDNCHSSITSMAPTYDGQCLAISCLDGTIRLMELETGTLLNTYHGSHKAGQYGLGVAILADDATIFSGSEDGQGVCYDLVRATCVQSLQTQGSRSPPQRRPTCAIAAHPQQSSVVITTSYDESAIVWANDSDVWQNQIMLQE